MLGEVMVFTGEVRKERVMIGLRCGFGGTTVIGNGVRCGGAAIGTTGFSRHRRRQEVSEENIVGAEGTAGAKERRGLCRQRRGSLEFFPTRGGIDEGLGWVGRYCPLPFGFIGLELGGLENGVVNCLIPKSSFAISKKRGLATACYSETSKRKVVIYAIVAIIHTKMYVHYHFEDKKAKSLSADLFKTHLEPGRGQQAALRGETKSTAALLVLTMEELGILTEEDEEDEQEGWYSKSSLY
ncbi:hypothetical protein L1887_29923 [Cichorium endivia]|nr:hypothetical protein L1887_29923 [Cichorium endivia]